MMDTNYTTVEKSAETNFVFSNHIRTNQTLLNNKINHLTLPYFPKSDLRSVARVVEDRPLTHRFLLFAVAVKQISTV